MTSNKLKFNLLTGWTGIIPFILLIFFVVSGCDEATEVQRLGAARIIPSVTVDATVITVSGNVPLPADLVPDPSDFAFTLQSADGTYSHTWSSVADYPPSELLRIGAYSASACFGSEYSEGFGSPFFEGSVNFNLENGEEKPLEINVTLASALINVEIDEKLRKQFNSVHAIVHSDGWSYIDYPANESRSAYIHPGNISIALAVTDDAGNSARVRICEITDARPRNFYKVAMTADAADEPTVTATVNGTESGALRLTRKLLAAPSPVITTTGFVDEEPVDITEGDTPASALVFSTDGGLSELILTSASPSLTEKGWPATIDLVKASDSDLAPLLAQGLAIKRSAEGHITEVNLTDVMHNLRSTPLTETSRFTLCATGLNGKMSQPVTLAVNVTPVTALVTAVSNVIIGLDMAQVTLLCRSGNPSANLSIEARNPGEQWMPCTIESITMTDDDEYSVRFKLPAGSSQHIDVRMLYAGSIMATATLSRAMPDYKIEIDAFALSAQLRVNVDDPTLVPLITEMLRIYVDGTLLASSDRDAANGTIFFGPLESNHRYTVTTTLLDNPSATDFTEPTVIRTERTLQIDNNDFEDHERNIDYKALPSGGRYSQSIADLYNCQNHTDIEVDIPRKWANINAKTFCRASSNPNTWFMSPSVISELDNVEGYFAVKLRSVAWDPHGEKIADYRQESGQFLPYNPNVPDIKYRAAGKIFLGKYTYDPTTNTETYTEGIAFTSRPVALNGNYRFSPSVADLYDAGTVIVEVIGMQDGNELVIARGMAQLKAALTYTAFSVPLTYNYFGVKAVRLKVMLASSRYVGSIDYESANIRTSPDPVTATSTGGTLWLQDITLSYF